MQHFPHFMHAQTKTSMIHTSFNLTKLKQKEESLNGNLSKKTRLQTTWRIARGKLKKNVRRKLHTQKKLHGGGETEVSKFQLFRRKEKKSLHIHGNLIVREQE